MTTRGGAKLILVSFDPTFLEVLSMSIHIGEGFFILSLPPRGSRDLSWGLGRMGFNWMVMGLLSLLISRLTFKVRLMVRFGFSRKEVG